MSHLNKLQISKGKPFIRTFSAESAPSEKRNVGSLKSSRVHGATKVKREIGYDNIPDEPEIVAPVYQTEPLNYEELYEAMNELYPNYDSLNIDDIQNEKRFLGKIECNAMLTSERSNVRMKRRWMQTREYTYLPLNSLLLFICIRTLKCINAQFAPFAPFAHL